MPLLVEEAIARATRMIKVLLLTLLALLGTAPAVAPLILLPLAVTMDLRVAIAPLLATRVTRALRLGHLQAAEVAALVEQQVAELEGMRETTPPLGALRKGMAGIFRILTLVLAVQMEVAMVEEVKCATCVVPASAALLCLPSMRLQSWITTVCQLKYHSNTKPHKMSMSLPFLDL